MHVISAHLGRSCCPLVALRRRVFHSRRVRIFLGFLVAAVALAAAVWLHTGLRADTYAVDTGITANGSFVGTQESQQRRHASAFAIEPTVFVTHHQRASWQDAAAVLVAVAGVGAGVGIALPGFRRT